MLVTYDEQAAFLDLPPGQDMELIEGLLTETIALFEKESGRENARFGVALIGRTEIHEAGPGSTLITLDYAIASITSIVSGRDVALPDETITPSDASTIVWRVGERDLIRVDGGYWRRGNYPSWVKVVYNTQADQPADVKLAVKQRVALIYQHRGKEGFASVTRGSRSWTMADPANQQSDWDRALNNHRRGWFR